MFFSIGIFFIALRLNSNVFTSSKYAQTTIAKAYANDEWTTAVFYDILPGFGEAVLFPFSVCITRELTHNTHIRALKTILFSVSHPRAMFAIFRAEADYIFQFPLSIFCFE